MSRHLTHPLVVDKTPPGPIPPEALGRCVAGLEVAIRTLERFGQPTLCRDDVPLVDATGAALDPSDPIWAEVGAAVDAEGAREQERMP